MTYKQDTLIITAPVDNAKQKEFLGYDWSKRKGAEGIQIVSPGGKMYCDNDRKAENTLAYLVRQSYAGIIPSIKGEAREYGERRPMNAICDTTAKSETISVKGCKVKITYASADTDCLDAIQKLLQTTILRTAGHTAA